MRIGQTSAIVFGAKLLTSILGFAATLYFARILGAEVLGYYSLSLTIAKWFRLFGDVGISSAVKKRISEDTNPEAYFSAGIIIIILFSILASVGITVFNQMINSYVGVDVAKYIILLLVSGLIGSLISAGLEGKRLVHITGLLSPITTGARSLIQILLVIAGFGLSGMLLGYAVGGIPIIVAGLLFLTIKIQFPNIKKFRSLFNYAKFSWLGSLKGRSFNDIDIIVLGALVSPSLVGIYSIAWNLTSFIGVFGSSIRQTMFPELSHADSKKQNKLFGELVTDSLAYSGMIAIPGVFGAALIGDRILRIYGDEFTRGYVILSLLILAMLIYDYQNQLLNALNALDRPDISFRVNAIFIVLNLLMNIVFVLWIGWVGAAIATVLAVSIGLLLALHYLRRYLTFEVPIKELGRQVAASLGMTVVVWVTEFVIKSSLTSIHNTIFAVGLVALGAGTYFLMLLLLSNRFRTTVVDNFPIQLPFIS